MAEKAIEKVRRSGFPEIMAGLNAMNADLYIVLSLRKASLVKSIGYGHERKLTIKPGKPLSKPVRKAVILAAGFGTRFLPATKSMPKEMIPIIDKPAIHYAVEEAVKAGIEKIIIITGRGKRAIEDYFDHSYELEDLLEIKGKKELLQQVRQISDMADIV